jgi:hypothetical protein
MTTHHHQQTSSTSSSSLSSISTSISVSAVTDPSPRQQTPRRAQLTRQRSNSCSDIDAKQSTPITFNSITPLDIKKNNVKIPQKRNPFSNVADNINKARDKSVNRNSDSRGTIRSATPPPRAHSARGHLGDDNTTKKVGMNSKIATIVQNKVKSGSNAVTNVFSNNKQSDTRIVTSIENGSYQPPSYQFLEKQQEVEEEENEIMKKKMSSFPSQEEEFLHNIQRQYSSCPNSPRDEQQPGFLAKTRSASRNNRANIAHLQLANKQNGNVEHSEPVKIQQQEDNNYSDEVKSYSSNSFDNNPKPTTLRRATSPRRNQNGKNANTSSSTCLQSEKNINEETTTTTVDQTLIKNQILSRLSQQNMRRRHLKESLQIPIEDNSRKTNTAFVEATPNTRITRTRKISKHKPSNGYFYEEDSFSTNTNHNSLLDDSDFSFHDEELIIPPFQPKNIVNDETPMVNKHLSAEYKEYMKFYEKVTKDIVIEEEQAGDRSSSSKSSMSLSPSNSSSSLNMVVPTTNITPLTTKMITNSSGENNTVVEAVAQQLNTTIQRQPTRSMVKKKPKMGSYDFYADGIHNIMGNEIFKGCYICGKTNKNMRLTDEFILSDINDELIAQCKKVYRSVKMCRACLNDLIKNDKYEIVDDNNDDDDMDEGNDNHERDVPEEKSLEIMINIHENALKNFLPLY